MIFLVSGSLKHVPDDHRRRFFGQLITPKTRNDVVPGVDWAADNGAFSNFDEAAFQRMLKKLEGIKGCRFVVAPDVVCDSRETLRLFEIWQPVIHAAGYPVALVLQDGQTMDDMPWGDLDAVFVGGSTEWKLGPDAAAICHEAKRRNKWVHMGRVNTLRRLKIARDFKCDSVDGTTVCKWGQKFIPLIARWMSNIERQQTLSWKLSAPAVLGRLMCHATR